MKKLLISAGLALCSTWNILATGVVPTDVPQSGVASFVLTNKVNVTFNAAYTYPPEMTLFGSVTNLLPFTNTVTTTGFTLYIAYTNGNPTTFGSVAWSAAPVNTRIQYGTAVASLAIATNVAVKFATPYAYVPNVVYSPASMVINSNQLSVISAITTTGFTLSCVGPETNYWQAIGPCVNAGFGPVSY